MKFVITTGGGRILFVCVLGAFFIRSQFVSDYTESEFYVYFLAVIALRNELISDFINNNNRSFARFFFFYLTPRISYDWFPFRTLHYSGVIILFCKLRVFSISLNGLGFIMWKCDTIIMTIHLSNGSVFIFLTC